MASLEKTKLHLGYIPLLDCAAILWADRQGYFQQAGLEVSLEREASWASLRDRLAYGFLDAAHCLSALLPAAAIAEDQPGIPLQTPLVLSVNRAFISLSQKLCFDLGISAQDSEQQAAEKVVKAIQNQHPLQLASVFQQSIHYFCLKEWLAMADEATARNIQMSIIPPPYMVEAMKSQVIDGFCVGEPWNARAINDRIGFTAATSQSVWADHPEKILGTRRDWVEKNPHTARALVSAVLDAARWIDASPENKRETAQLLSRRAWLNTKEQYLTGRMLGEYDNGIGQRWQDAHPIRFFNDGAVSYPYHSDGMWFLTQFRRWGLLKTAPDYAAIAQRINQTSVWQDAATAVGGITAPSSPYRSSTLMDGTVWSGTDPEGYANRFAIHRKGA